MDRATLAATKRQEIGTHAARRLRRQGLVPAVLYGRQRDTVHLSVPQKEFERLFHGGARLLDIEIGGTLEPVLIQDLQYDALGDHILHVDFTRVAMDEAITVTVPLELHGMPKGVTEGGTLEQGLMDIEVSCLPGDIPERIRIEVAHLEIGDTIHLGDLVGPPGVEFVGEDETPVVSVHAPQELEEPEEAAETQETLGTEPEIIGREAEDRESREADEKG